MKDTYRVVRENLAASDASLTSFCFHLGGNIYAFTYRREGTVRHKLSDSGDPRHADRILGVFADNGIDPANIERILVTHRHPDHSGLAALLAQASKAKILVHQRFRSFVEEGLAPRERSWFGNFDPSVLKNEDIVYLSERDGRKPVSIFGIAFPVLADPIEMGGLGRLHVLACPESSSTHSPDQLIVIYSARAMPLKLGQDDDGYLPTNDIVFAGDLWLMQGPQRVHGIGEIPRLLGFRVRRAISGNHRRNYQEQDAAAKEALKRCFCLVRVKPGHGDEFLGSRMIPNGLLADRDMLVELGYESNADRSLLRDEVLAARVASLKRTAYLNFVGELSTWLGLGFSTDEASRLLGRIYREQSGGGTSAVKIDRKQRRARLREALSELKGDTDQDPQLRRVAVAALAQLSARLKDE